MSLPLITEALIRQNSSPESFQRGHDYYQQGAVLSLVQRGATLDAEVEGSEPEPYRVRVTFAGISIQGATCTCPYEYGGWCKHIVAALLTAARKPEQVKQRPPLADVLAKLNRDQLQALVLKLVEHEPDLADTVELQAGLLAVPAPSLRAGGTPAAALPTVDVALLRRRMRSIMRSAGDWEEGAMSGVVAEVSQLLEQAWEHIRAGNGRNALAMLDAITPEYVESWYEFDDSDGEGGDFFREIGAAWAEALLTAGLPKQERAAWAGKLTAWAGEVAGYGIDDAFDPAVAAAEQGWDDPHLQRILQGKSTPADRAVPQRASDFDAAWDDGENWAAHTLAAARLNVLERQGRYEELVRLADAEGQALRAALTLVQLGRNHDAIARGLERLVSARDAFELAQALHLRGETAGAIQVAGRGLDLGGRKAELANWLRDLAAQRGDVALALHAARAAFEEQLDLPRFLKAQELAGDQWSDLRAELLERLRGVKSYVPAGPVEVFLHEGLLDDAIAAVEKGAGHELVERVVDAALTVRPNWAIAACRQQAEWIMDGGKAEYYDAAARWLAKARTAYQAAGRGEEWRTYLGDLLKTHQRKYKLRPMLEALR